MRDHWAKVEGAITWDGVDDTRLTRQEYLAVKLARHLADNPWRVNEELLTELRTEYDDAEIIEMIFSCAIFSWGNIIGISTRVDVDVSSEYQPGLTYEEGERRARAKRTQQAASVCRK